MRLPTHSLMFKAYIYILSVGLNINGWSDNGPTIGRTIFPTNNKLR